MMTEMFSVKWKKWDIIYYHLNIVLKKQCVCRLYIGLWVFFSLFSVFQIACNVATVLL